MAPGSAVAWVSTNAEAKLNVSPAATNLLVSSTRPSAPVNLVSILGPARNGKSSLMNTIVGTGDTFAMSDSVKACTKGGDLSRSVVRLADLDNTNRYQSDWAESRLTPSRGANEDIYVAFADVEGQGDESEEHDVRLSTPFLLLSKVIIFNWLGRPNKTTMLEKLEVMVLATDKIKQQDGDGGCFQEKVFGHLIILARDLSGPEKAEEIRELLLNDEDAGRSTDRKGATNRNTIRAGLRNSFESIVVRTLPVPHPRITELGTAIPLSDFTPKYKATVKDLKVDIVEMLRTPHLFGGSPILGGDTMSMVMTSLCDAVNDAKDISPPSLLQAIDLQKVQKAKADALVLFELFLDEVSGYTFSSMLASRRIESAKVSAMAEFQHLAQPAAQSVVQEEEEKLQKNMAALAAAAVGLQDKKRSDLDKQLKDAAKKGLSSVDDQAKRMSVPLSYPVTVERAWDRIIRDAFAAFTKDLARIMPGRCQGDLARDLKWALTRTEFSDKAQDSLVRLKSRNDGALQLQAHRTQMQAAHRREREAREEARNALQDRERAERAAREAEQKAEEDMEAMRRQLLWSTAFDDVYSPPMRHHPRRVPRSRSMEYGWRPTPSSRGRFYPGGVFIPGGGRAPAGGIWM